MYYTYMLRCIDNSLYTGITTDLERRINEHTTKSIKGAKYTKSHEVKKLEISWESADKTLASKLEYHLKQLPKEKKEILIKNPNQLDKILGNKIDSKLYNYYK